MRAALPAIVCAILLVETGLALCAEPRAFAETDSAAARSQPTDRASGKAPGEESNVEARVLIDRLGAENRFEAAMALLKMGPKAEEAFPALIEAFLKDAPLDRRVAAHVLFKGAQPKEVVAELVQGLADDRSSSSSKPANPFSGAYGLAWVGGPDAKEAVPALIQLLRHENKHPRNQAAIALGMIGTESREAVPALIETTQDFGTPDMTFKYARASAAFALGSIGPESKSAVPALVRMLKGEAPPGPDIPDPNWEYHRACAAFALGRIGPGAGEAVPALIAALEDSCPVVRSYAAKALGAMGSIAKDALSGLRRSLQDGDAHVRDSARRALAKIAPEPREALPRLISQMKDGDANVRRLAAESLSGIGPGAVEAVPALIQALGDAEPTVRACSARALGDIGPEARQAVPALMERLADAHVRICAFVEPALNAIGPRAIERLRESVSLALGYVGSRAKPGVPGSLQAFGFDDQENYVDYFRSMGEIHREVIPVVLEALEDEGSNVRAAAAAALGGIGLRTEDLVLALNQALQDDDWVVRRAAADALYGISRDRGPSSGP